MTQANQAPTDSYNFVFKELSRLEKDHRRIVAALKMRDEEHAKLTSLAAMRDRDLEAAYAQLEAARVHAQTMGARLSDAEERAAVDRDQCAQVVQKLTAKVATLEADRAAAVDEYERLLVQTRDELQKQHEHTVDELRMRHADNVAHLEEQLHAEVNHARQLQTKLEFTLEEHVLLQDKVLKLQQEFMPMEAYRSQMASVAQANEKLKKQVMQLQAECQTLGAENVRLQVHEEKSSALLVQRVNAERQCAAQRDEIYAQLAKAQLALRDANASREVLQARCESLEAEKVALEERANEVRCDVTEHTRILEQNNVLQELVKEMRKERRHSQGEQLVLHDLQDTEKRVNRLEDVIHELKKCAMEDDVCKKIRWRREESYQQS